MISALCGQFMRRIGASMLLATGVLVFPAATHARTIVYPQPAYQPYHHPAHRYYPSTAYQYNLQPRRTCPRTERRWVPRDVRYDRYGNVDRVRGRYVTARFRVPC